MVRLITHDWCGGPATPEATLKTRIDASGKRPSMSMRLVTMSGEVFVAGYSANTLAAMHAAFVDTPDALDKCLSIKPTIRREADTVMARYEMPDTSTTFEFTLIATH